MATIKIKRTNEFNNRMRDYKIFIDGQNVGTIANGQTKDFQVTPGRHSVVAKIDWCSSPERSFDCNDSDTKTFLVGGFNNGNWIIPLALGITVLHFILKYTLDFNYLMFLIIPAGLLLIYYLTIGHKDYLTLTMTN